MEHKEVPLEELEIEVQSFLIPKGTERLKATKDNLSRKKTVICIKDTDTMCAARAIVTAVSVFNKDRWTSAQLQSLRKSRQLQEKEALKLHQDSGVPVKDKGNDFADLKTFAKHLGIKLKVFSGDVFGEICFETGELNDHIVCLLKNGNHFDVITSLPGFFGENYFCKSCNKRRREEISINVLESVLLASRSFPMEKVVLRKTKIRRESNQKPS